MSRGAILGLIGALALAGAAGVLWLGGGDERAVEPAASSRAESSVVERVEPAQPVELRTEATTSERELHLLPEVERTVLEDAPAKLHVRVVEKGNGAPISGARLTLLDFEPHLVRESGVDGRCSFELPPTESRWILVQGEKEGFFHARDRHPASPELEISLAPATTLFGRILAADTSAPVPGARVSLLHGCEGCEPSMTTTGGDGTYELVGVPRHLSANLEFRAEGFATLVRTFEIRSDEERVEQDFHLERGIGISGRVVDFHSGAGIPGAVVGDLVADESGSFRGQVLPETGVGEIILWVMAADHCGLSVATSVERLGEPFEFRLPRPTIVEGVVRDAEGQPIPSARVYIREKPPLRSERDGIVIMPTPLDELPQDWTVIPEGYDSVGETDEQGRFRVTNVPPWNQLLELKCTAEGYASNRHRIERVGGPGEAIRIDLLLEREEPEAKVRGRVLLNGVTLHAARGRLRWTGRQRSGEIPIRGASFTAQVEPGNIAFQLELEDLTNSLEGTEFALEIKAGSELEHAVELRMPTRQISGRVLHDDGTPVPKAEVRASCPLRGNGRDRSERIQTSTEAAADGAYALEVPDWDRLYRVEARVHHVESVVDGIVAGASDVDLVLPLLGRMRFRVLDEKTRAPIDTDFLEFEWKHSNEEDFRSWSIDALLPDADGWYEDWLPSGRLALRVWAAQRESGYRPATLENVLVPSSGVVPRFEFVLRRSSPLELRLAEGQTVIPDDHLVTLVEESLWDSVDLKRAIRATNIHDSDRIGVVFFGEDGTAKVHALAPGRYRFKIFPSDIAVEPGEILFQDPMSEPVVVRWRWVR